MKLWGGRFTENTDSLVEAYTGSIRFDQRLSVYDLTGSLAHVRMLKAAGIVPAEEAAVICDGLQALLEEATQGTLEFDVSDEDIHMNVERLLHQRIGAVAGKLHTARSRNDQVALDMHLYMRDAVKDIITEIRHLQSALVTVGESHMDVIIPGYTHLQRAQPVLLTHHFLAYFWMLQRDVERFSDSLKRIDLMPLGAGALAGTTFPISRELVMSELGFTRLYENSLDAVSDRDYLIEFLSNASLTMMHLSRLAEELILWTSEEFHFIELNDAYCTGSSMMPQKKNPDVAELVRGKTGRVYGHLIALLTVLKGLPLAYNKDLQEDKEGVFDTVETLLPALRLFAGMIETVQVRREELKKAFQQDFSNATDVADYLAAKGVPFREAHGVVGALVLRAIQEGRNLVNLSLDEYRSVHQAFDNDIYAALSIETVVGRRQARGGTAPTAVLAQLELAKKCLTDGH